MSLEAIERVTQEEDRNRERKAESVLKAKKLIQDAQGAGTALLQATRTAEEATGKQLLAEAEKRAQLRAEKRLAEAREEGDALAKNARLDDAAAEIVRRVVKD